MDTAQNGKWMLEAEKMYTIKGRNCQHTTVTWSSDDPHYFHGVWFPYNV